MRNCEKSRNKTNLCEEYFFHVNLQKSVPENLHHQINNFWPIFSHEKRTSNYSYCRANIHFACVRWNLSLRENWMWWLVGSGDWSLKPIYGRSNLDKAIWNVKPLYKTSTRISKHSLVLLGVSSSHCRCCCCWCCKRSHRYTCYIH